MAVSILKQMANKCCKYWSSLLLGLDRVHERGGRGNAERGGREEGEGEGDEEEVGQLCLFVVQCHCSANFARLESCHVVGTVSLLK